MLSRKYEAWEEFFGDVDLMCSNAFTYNEDDSEVYKDARQIKVGDPRRSTNDELMTEYTGLPPEGDQSPASRTSGHEVQSQSCHTCWISSDWSNLRTYTPSTPNTRRSWTVPPRSTQRSRHGRSRRLTRAISIIRTASLGGISPTGIDADLPADPSWKRS